MLPTEPRVYTRSALVSEVAKKSNTSAAIKELAHSQTVEEERRVKMARTGCVEGITM